MINDVTSIHLALCVDKNDSLRIYYSSAILPIFLQITNANCIKNISFYSMQDSN